MSEVDVMDAEGETPFSLAVEQGHTEIVSYLYQTYDIASDLESYKFVLHRAALCGHNDLVRFFIDHKWDVNSRDLSGRTPLHFTARNDHLQAASMLIDAGADVNAVDEFRQTPLYYAASDNSPKVAQRLLEAGANLNPLDYEDDTPLYQAAYRGSPEVVNVLLSRLPREDLNFQCSGGWTALQAAYDSPEIVKTLLAAGANPFILDSYSRTSLALAFENSYEETCNELISVMEKQALQDVNLQMAAIHEIAAVGNIQALDKLFVSGVDFDIRGEDGVTALHRACRNGQKETGAPIAAASAGGSADIVELLLSKGVKIDSVDEEDNTPLTLALAMGHTEIARLLLKNGANLGRKHGSALKIAIERENLDLVKFLLENGANAAIDIPGFPPLLHVAAQTNNREIMEALVKAGMSDLAVCDSAGRSLLIVAIFNKAQQIVDFLLEHQGLNLDVQDGAGRTALSIAAAQGSHVVAELLLRKANPDIPDMEGKTALIYSILNARGRNPLYWACLTDNTEVFEVTLQAVQDSESLISLIEDALQAAVAVKRSDFVQKLLSNPDVNPNVPSGDGWSPLFTAQHLKLPEIERHLLDANAVEDIPASSEPYPRPSRFHPQEGHVALHVSETGKEVTVGACPIDLYSTSKPFSAIRSDYPMNGIGIIGIGFCDEKAPLHRMLGWDEGSWGYHGDDGKSFEGRGIGIKYGDVYSTGDTIGCYVNPSRGTAFYTINGKSLRQSPFLAFLSPLICPPLITPHSSD
ncbi:Ankyrin repeat-containing domain protein [Penicillium cf. viridicatum]|uniref:Ankyrin repeat-containing domain protein n=1 Tax=Penicillium cf. viridicatum TaxID=2972119 RepID=A0A9W9M5A3_9EURO|nr:Ankyrin repeat-containing domain protein [Penicillium cf. viridicatum]